ncbi:MAG: hypothetical protein AAFX08_04480 [Pseudomonadota bacterium]
MGLAIGLLSFGAFLAAVVGILRQLGAGDAARALLIVTFLVFGGMVAATYLPVILTGM